MPSRRHQLQELMAARRRQQQRRRCMQKYVSTRSFSAVPKGDAMGDALENPLETAEVDIRTMTAVPLPWFTWGGGSSWSPSSTVVDGGGWFT